MSSIRIGLLPPGLRVRARECVALHNLPLRARAQNSPQNCAALVVNSDNNIGFVPLSFLPTAWYAAVWSGFVVSSREAPLEEALDAHRPAGERRGDFLTPRL